MRWLLELFRALFRSRSNSLVRPWALSAPVLILLLAMPLLRPVRHPDPREVGDEEMALLATTQALVEQKTLAIDHTFFSGTRRKVEKASAPVGMRWYADQPPTMAFLLSGPYRLMNFYDLTFASDTPTVAYLLTLLGVALPAACAAGLIYRMGRLFDLPRPLRSVLAVTSILGTGMFSYSTVLNPHVPAACLVLASAACLVHLAIAIKRPFTPIWLLSAGACATTAAAIDPSALPFLPLMLCVVPAFRWSAWARVGGVLIFLLGTVGPIALHATLAMRSTGDLYQGMGFAPTTALAVPVTSADSHSTLSVIAADEEPKTVRKAIGQAIYSVAAALLGRHGLLSHFPILVLGVLGMTMVMHRHWPTAAKVLASATLAGTIFLLLAYAVHRPSDLGWRDAMFASRWFVVIGPLLLFWAGAWLRKSHRPASWAMAGILLAFSVATGLIGATNPWPRNGFSGYTARESLVRLWQSGGRDGDGE